MSSQGRVCPVTNLRHSVHLAAGSPAGMGAVGHRTIGHESVSTFGVTP
jgi:hypothetical protein